MDIEQKELSAKFSTLNNKAQYYSARVENLNAAFTKLEAKVKFYQQNNQQAPESLSKQYLLTNDKLIDMRLRLEDVYTEIDVIQEEITEYTKKVKELEEKTVEQPDVEIKLDK